MIKFDPRYFAGFVDGEGCISIYGKMSKVYRTHTVAVRISNNKMEPLEILKNRYGGWLGKQKPNKPNQNWSYAYYITGRRAYSFIKEIAPFLIIKKIHANLILDNWSFLRPMRGGHVHWLTEEVKAKRHEIYLQIHKLNKRGLS